MDILVVAIGMLFVLAFVDVKLWPRILPQARAARRSRSWAARALPRSAPRRRPQRPTTRPVPVWGVQAARHHREAQARWWWE
jgi:hypothetical protein